MKRLLIIFIMLLLPLAAQARPADWKYFDVRLAQEDIRIYLPLDWQMEKNSLTEFVAKKDHMSIHLAHAFTCNKEFGNVNEKLSQYLGTKSHERSVEKIQNTTLSTFAAKEITYIPNWAKGGRHIDEWREIEKVDGHGHSLRLAGPEPEVRTFLPYFREIAKDLHVWKLCSLRP